MDNSSTFTLRATAVGVCSGVLALVALRAQYQVEWQRCIGGVGQDFAYGITLGADGGYTMGGFLRSHGVLVDNCNHSTLKDGLVTHLDAAGTTLWQRCLGGADDDRFYAIATAQDSGYFAAGTTASTDGDVVGYHGGDGDAWVVRLNNAGDLIWQRCLGGTEFDAAYALAATADGGCIVAGTAWSTDGDVSGNHGAGDGWLVKLATDGTIEWQRCLGGAQMDYFSDVAVVGTGGYILAGTTLSNDGDVTGYLGDPGWNDNAWVVKVDPDGNLQWQQVHAPTLHDRGRAIAPLPSGGYLFAGSNSSIDIGNTEGHGGGDFWVAKLNGTGLAEWERWLGGTSGDFAMDVAVDDNGDYFVSGYSGSVNGDVSGNHGDYDGWVLSLEETGELQWELSLGGSDRDQLYAGTVVPGNGYMVAGITKSEDGDVVGQMGSPEDAWVVKLGMLTTGITDNNAPSATISPNPAQDLATISFSPGLRPERIALIDVMGRLVLEQTVAPAAPSAQLVLGSLPNGLYRVKLFGPEPVAFTLPLLKW